MKKLVLPAIALLLTLAGTSFIADANAQGAPGGRPDWFNRIDTNKDGVVTKDEWDAYYGELFSALDVVKDGKLTKDDYLEFQKRVMENRARAMQQSRQQ